MPLAADLAAEAGVADDGVDPVIEPVTEVVGPACVSYVRNPVKRTFRPSALPSPSVSLRKSMWGAWATIRPPFDVEEARRDAEVIRKERELVGPAVAVGVLEDEMRSRPLPFGCISLG